MYQVYTLSIYAYILTHISLLPDNSADPVQAPQNAASDQSLHCLVTESSIIIGIKIINTMQQPFKGKRTGPTDDSGKFHLA